MPFLKKINEAKMKNGPGRFEYYLQKLENLLQQSRQEMNPALWLYQNDARTVVFMLEGLSKLYAGLHNKKRFGKIKEDLKLLEDGLGVIDYYDAYSKEFIANSRIPSPLINYLEAQAREKIQHLNDILIQRGWIDEDVSRISKIRKKLSDADWMKDDEEMKEIRKFYKKSIDDINAFFSSINNRVTEIETHAHELRRKLRWLSIYPRALQGAIQLTTNSTEKESIAKYLTEEIVQSPYNKMPDAGNNRYLLMLEKDYFLSLSWMISAMGKLKDDGLRIVCVSEAIMQTRGKGKAEALALAYRALGEQQPRLTSILNETTGICDTFFSEKNLDKLVAGINAVN